jgi:hypothetical protein
MTIISEDQCITYSIEEIESNCENNSYKKSNLLDIDRLLNEIEQTELENHDDFMIPHMIDYHENFVIKELLLICEYYGFAKELKANKCNKEQIIYFLVKFESQPTNVDIVFRRQNMWFYMKELKNDKFMKRFLLPF